MIQPAGNQTPLWVVASCSCLAFFAVAAGAWLVWCATRPPEEGPLVEQVAALPAEELTPRSAAPAPLVARAPSSPAVPAGSAPPASTDATTAPPVDRPLSPPDTTSSAPLERPVAPPAGGAPSAAPSDKHDGRSRSEPTDRPRRGFAEPDLGGENQGALGPSGAPADWRVQVDPLAEPLVFLKDLSIPLGGRDGEILFPTARSPYALVGKPHLLEVWDLRTGGKVRSVKTDHLRLADMRLSADGDYVASWNPQDRVGDGAGASVLVGKLTSKKTSTIEVGQERTFDGFFDFGAPGQLIARAGKDSQHISVWNIEKNERLHEIPTALKVDEQSPAVSPGRRYLAWVEDELELVIADLTTGQIAGRTVLPGERPKCQGMVFSHDGALLAGIFEVFPKSALYCWDVASGRLVNEFDLEFENEMRMDLHGMRHGLNERPLEWLADNSAWLLAGRAIFHRGQGKLIFSFPAPKFGERLGPRRILDERRVAGLTGSEDTRMLGVATLPKNEIARGSEVIAGGGGISDVGLPPLTEGDTSATALVALGAAAGWRVKPDPAPAEAAGVRRQTPVVFEIGQPGPPLISPDGSRAVLWGSQDLTHGPPRRRNSQSKGDGLLAIESYDLQKGKRIGGVSMNYKGRVLAAAPDVSRVAVATEKTFHSAKDAKVRIDVYSLPDGKPVAGFRPYDRTDLAFRHYTAFVGSDLLVTGGWDVPLTAWSLPDCRAVYLVHEAQPRQLSPGGKYLLATARGCLHFLDAATGEPLGTIPLTDDVTAAAFNAQGTKLAIATGVSGSITASGLTSVRLRTWELTTGQPELDFAVPLSAGTIEWCGDEHLLLDNRSLVNLKQQGIVWNYNSFSNGHASTGNRHWWLTRTGANQFMLCRTELPDAAPAKAAAVQRSDQGLLRPGMRISLSVNLGGVPSSVADLPKRVTDHFQKSLEQNGFIVGPGGEMTLTASATIANTSEKVQIRQAINQQTQEAFVKVMTCEVALSRGSEKLWSVNQKYGNRDWGLVSLRKGQTLDDLFSEVLWKSGAEKYFFRIAAPKQIYPESMMTAVGQSDLSPR